MPRRFDRAEFSTKNLQACKQKQVVKILGIKVIAYSFIYLRDLTNI